MALTASLTVVITGGMDIDQGDEVTLSATVTDENGDTPVGDLEYAWSANRGSFVGAINEASAVYDADFTDSSDVVVVVTCDVTRVADADPTVDTASLTAMTELGITGQVLNMYINPTDDTAGNISNVYDENSGGSTLETGSDDDLDTDIHIWRVRWNSANNFFILNNDGIGNLYQYFLTIGTKSVFIIFDDGVVEELSPVDFGNAGFARWSIGTQILANALTDLDTTSMFLVGVGDTDSIGLDEDTGSDTESFTAAAVAPLTTPSAPRNLTATAQTNGTSVLLNWDAPSDNGGAAITDYEYSSDDGSTWTAIGSTNTEYTVTGLDKNTEYTFQVRAVNSQGNSLASAAVTETTATTVPGTPTSLSVTTTQTTAALSWTAPTDTGGTPITEYQYRYQEGSTADGTWTDTNSTATSVTISNLTANTEYTFQVRAVNSVGNSAASSAETVSTDAETLVATTIVEVSGDSQSAVVSTALSDPFIVEVRDQNGDALSGVTVAFAVTAGGGTLSATSVTTNASGRAESTLTLGSTTGTNTVTATASGIATPITFTATATAVALVATNLVRISGNNQTATVSTELSDPFVVEVRDQDGDALSGVTVAFAVTAGGGTLSTASVTTGSNGRASSTLTLGSTAGTNTVTATASSITTPVTFTATGTAVAPQLSISVTVPVTADLGETVDISATVAGEDSIEWKTTGGSIDDTSAADTEITVPSESGVIAVTGVATDVDGATESDTAYVTVGDPAANIYTPAVRIEMEGQDITSRWIRDDGISVGKSLAYPQLSTFLHKRVGVQCR